MWSLTDGRQSGQLKGAQPGGLHREANKIDRGSVGAGEFRVPGRKVGSINWRTSQKRVEETPNLHIKIMEIISIPL